MGELWRSQEMQLVQLYIEIEGAHDTVDELGQLGIIEFRDLNIHVTAFQRHFINEVKRAEEMARSLRYFDDEIFRFNEYVKEENRIKGEHKPVIKIEPYEQEPELKGFYIDDLEVKLVDKEQEIRQMNKNQEALYRTFQRLSELELVLREDEQFFSETKDALQELDYEDDKKGKHKGKKEKDEKENEDDVEEGITLEDIGGKGEVKLGFLSGTVLEDKFLTFERVLFRATRGNLFMKHSDSAASLTDMVTGEVLTKTAFIIFFQGKMLGKKIKKVCESLGACLFDIPDKKSERAKLSEEVKERIEDHKILLDKGSDQRFNTLNDVAAELSVWGAIVMKEKAIYHTMNKMNYDIGRKCLIAEGWCPKSSIDVINESLETARFRSGSTMGTILQKIDTVDNPPTYFKTNKFTRPFQAIVDAYGVARYQEINPTVFTIITFPFEVGIMFGDVGHGFILLLLALILIYMERHWEGKKMNEMVEMIYYGRYVILLMALFSMYMGALYNDMFALPMDFGTNWRLQLGPQYDNDTFEQITPNSPYAFGVDPVWTGCTNALLYYNSLKMKMSILIGVIQMTLGLFLHLLNSIYFRKELDVLFEFLPRFIFLEAIFGYLCFMIFYKWNTDYPGQDLDNILNNRTGNDTLYPYCGTGNAPVILNQLIYMFLPGGPTNNPLYNGQPRVQTILVVLAFVSVPFMMLPKPFILKHRHKQLSKNITHPVVESDGEDSITSEDHEVAVQEVHEEFEFGEVMVHQILETIEFVLGSVSHTASYLRLWALSLAHTELASVFWDKIYEQLMQLTASMGIGISAIAVWAGYSAWFFATLVVLMFMECLSAFLHALRLHWVEFQSKFYRGDGHPFQPFSYHRILSGEDEEYEEPK